MNKFIVMNAPFVHSGNDVNKMFLYTAVALLIPAVYGMIFFGFETLILLAVSIIACAFAEVLFNFIKKKKIYISNFSFFVTALVLALTLPVNTPYYVVFGSAFFSIFVVKQVFGGLGLNKFNPALCGRCLAGIIAPALSSELYTFVLNEETYVSLTSGGVNSLTNLFTGQAVGGIGTTCVILIVVCGLFLGISRIIDLKLPIIAILSYIVVGSAMVGYEQAVMNLCSGSFIFACVFMITDPNTSPDTIIAKILYSILFGSISAIVWQTGSLGENSIFFVALVLNIVAPILDYYIVLKPISIGGYRNAYKK